MREMSLADIQGVSLDILDAVDGFCTKKGIKYSLGYGGLIGAVRHKGPIPWDDDIDIIMERPEYNRFIECFNQECPRGLKLYAPELGNSYFSISRICDMSRTFVRKYYQWTDEDTGVWIDVFPVDGLPSDRGEQIRRLTGRCFNICGARVPLSLDFSMSRVLKIIGKRVLYGWYSNRKAVHDYLQEVQKCDYESSPLVCNFSSPYILRDIHRKEVFSSYERVPFANQTVSILKNYDEYLTNIYDDYMTPPPKDKQVRSHSDNKYYWR